jgi:replicative DNA helicase
MKSEDKHRIEEEAVLGGMLLWDGPWPTSVLELRAEWFSTQQRVHVFEAMGEIAKRGGKVDEVSTIAQLGSGGVRGQSRYILDLAYNCPTAVNLANWADLIIERGRKREVARSVKDAMGRIGEDSSADQVASAVQDAVRNIRPRSDSGLVAVRDSIAGVLRDLEEEYRNPGQNRIAATGLKDLDRILFLEPSGFTIIAARPSMGKSALSGNIAAYCAKDITKGATALFSLEMATSSLIKRMIAAESRFPSDLLPQKSIEGQLAETAQSLYERELYIDDRSGLSIMGIRRALARFPSVRLICVDYLQLVQLENAERHDLKIGKVTKELKALSKEQGCHVIALCQLNRSVEQRSDPTPKLSDLRDSGNIEEDADNVLLLYRPSYYDTSKDENLAMVIIAKQRNGRTGTIQLGWDGPTQRFYDWGGD